MIRFLGLTGHTGAGKSTAAKFLEENYGAIVVRHSDLARPLLSTLGQPDTQANVAAVMKWYVDTIGARAISEAVHRKIDPILETKPDVWFVIDGIRFVASAEYDRAYAFFCLLAIEAEQQLRYERVKTREEKPDQLGMSC